MGELGASLLFGAVLLGAWCIAGAWVSSTSSADPCASAHLSACCTTARTVAATRHFAFQPSHSVCEQERGQQEP